MSTKETPTSDEVLSGFRNGIVLREHPFELGMDAKELSIGDHTSMLVWMRENLDRGNKIEFLRYLETGSGENFSENHVIFFEAMIGVEAMMCAVKGFDGVNLFGIFWDLAHKYSQHLQRIEISAIDIADAQSTIGRYAN